MTRRHDVLLRFAPWLALAILVAVTFAPCVENGFTFDDDMVVADADYLLSRPELTPKIFTDDYFELSGESTFRPVTTLTYMLDRQLGGGSPRAFHLSSVAWHLATVLLAFAVFGRVGASVGVAFVAAAVFAVHPLVTEAVDNVSFREDLLATAFGLAALLLLVRRAASVWIASLGGMLSLFGMLAKESAFAFVVLVPWTAWSIAGYRGMRTMFVAHRAALTALAAAVAIFALLRFGVFATLGDYGDWPGGSLASGVATGLHSVAWYLRLVVVPHPLCADYRGAVAPITELSDARLWIALAIVAALGVAAWLSRRRNPLVTWGVVWFFVALAPVSNIVPIPVFMAERFTYLPLVGLALAATAGIHALLPPRLVVVRVALALAVVTTLATLTWHRHAIWLDNESLWSATLEHYPEAYGALHGVGVAFEQQGRFAAAIDAMTRALEHPELRGRERAATLGDRGIAHGRDGQLDAAVRDFEASIALSPIHKTHYNLGITLLRMRRPADAERELRRSIALRPHYAPPYAPLADLAQRRGDSAEARRLAEMHRRLIGGGPDWSGR